MSARFSAATVSGSSCRAICRAEPELDAPLPPLPIAARAAADAPASWPWRCWESTRSRISRRMLSTSVSAITHALTAWRDSNTLALQSFRTRGAAPGGHAGIEVGNSFCQGHTRDSYEERSIQPIISLPVATVDCQRDRILIDAKPTVESKSNLDHLTTTHGAKLYLLLFRVRAVGMNAVEVAYKKTYDRIGYVVIKTRHHAQRYRLAAL